MTACLAALSLLFAFPAEEPRNPWIERAPAAVASVASNPSAATFRDALDVLRRGDAWTEAADVARTARSPALCSAPADWRKPNGSPCESIPLRTIVRRSPS
jgi:hypothetical protein